MPVFTIEYYQEDMGECIQRIIDDTPSYTKLAKRVEWLRSSIDAKNIRVNGKNIEEVGFPRVTSWKAVKKHIDEKIIKETKENENKEINKI